MSDDQREKIVISAALINEQPTPPVVYEDRIRISRNKFESLFGWKAVTDIQQEPQTADDEDSGAEGDGTSVRHQAVDNSTSDSPVMPSCICEIMRENRVTVVPSFRRGANNTSGLVNLPEGRQTSTDPGSCAPQQIPSKNKRDYVLRIFGDNEADVAAAKFKIQSAVHQVAVMGPNSTSSSSVAVNNNNNNNSNSSDAPVSVPGPINGENVKTTSGPWWANVSDRLTLRVDVDYTVHSHLIGRNGGNIASVMRATQTHIHFPDSNKQSSLTNNRSGGAGSGGSRSVSPSLGANGFSSTPPVKNNYVTVSGPGVDQVEEARQYIRRMTPLRLAIPFSTLNVPLSLTGQVFVPARLAASSRRVMQEFCDRGLSAAMRNDSLVVSGTMSVADLVIQATMQICLEVYECLVPVSLSVDVTPRDWAFVRGPGDCYTRKIEHATGCQFIFPNLALDDVRNSADGRRQPVRIVGFPANVVKARFLLQCRLPIQLSWPLRSQMSSIHESDAALKEIVASKYEIFMTMRDRSGRNNQSGNANHVTGHDSGSATPDIAIGGLQSHKARPASSGAAAYHIVQPKHIVLKSFEGNLPNVYRFYAYMRDLSYQPNVSKPPSRAGSRVDDDMTTSNVLPTPPQSPSWWLPIPADLSDDEMFQKVDALVHDGFLMAARSNPAFAATAAAAPLSNATGLAPLLADPQVLYTAYALALAQQQQQQQQQSASVLAALAATNNWAPSAGFLPPMSAAKTPIGLLGRGSTLITANPLNNQTHAISVAAASRAVLSQRNAEQATQRFSPRSFDDGASSPESNSSASLENYNIVIDDKIINNHIRSNNQQQQRSVSSMSSNHDTTPEGRPITAASRFAQHMSFDNAGTEADRGAADRLLEQFAASLTKAGSQHQHGQSAVIVSAESRKIYEIPRRSTSSIAAPGDNKLPANATVDPIATGILSSVIGGANEGSAPHIKVTSAQPLGHPRIPTAAHCGLLFSLSQPDGLINQNVGPVPSPLANQKLNQQQQPGQNGKFSGHANFGASSVVVGDKTGHYQSSQQDQLAMMGSVGGELFASRTSSTNGHQGRSLSITGGFATKLQTTELYYEQFADHIDERLGAALIRAGVARSDIGKLASQEVKLEAFMMMSDNDLRDCGIWQLGVRRQLLRIIADLHAHGANTNPPLQRPSDSNVKEEDAPLLSVNGKSALLQPATIEISSQQQPHQQLQPPNLQQLPPQSPPFFASLKTYRLESEFRLL